MFYDNYIRLCNSVGKSPSAVAIEIGIAKPTVNRWKHGSRPTDATLGKIARYFGVSTDELLGKDNKKTPTPEGERSMSNKDLKFALWGDCENMSDDDLADVLRYAAFVKERKKV